jgi:hypothetical protein
MPQQTKEPEQKPDPMKRYFNAKTPQSGGIGGDQGVCYAINL